MFEHHHLPNVGLTQGRIPSEIYQTLNKEIVEIHANDKDIVRMNPLSCRTDHKRI